MIAVGGGGGLYMIAVGVIHDSGGWGLYMIVVGGDGGCA